MPLIIRISYIDETSEIIRIPAEIWRRNESEVTKLFVKDKEVDSVLFDPFKELADVDMENNVFPNKNKRDSRFDKFKKDGN